MFGFQRRLVRRCEWLTLMPHDGFLPHISHTAAIGRCRRSIVGLRYRQPSDRTGVVGRRSTTRPPRSSAARRTSRQRPGERVTYHRTAVTAVDRLDAPDLRAVIETYRDALGAHREPINRLNVYPVPDGDTGTNMALTLESVCAELAGADDDLAAVCRAITHGSLMGARGNSGVILSQILRGLSDAIADATRLRRPVAGRGAARPRPTPPTAR